ncbi:hypothetical protein [Bordetella pertussis]|uniref:hypothetical protein n=1 Tax=Bordetella pertussis TaxID=520 RepID=UPI0039B7564C
MRIEKPQRADTSLVIDPHQEVDRLQRRRLSVLLSQPRMRTPDHAFAPRVRRSVLQRAKEYFLRVLYAEGQGKSGDSVKNLASRNQRSS